MSIEFKATREQIKQIAANAVNASIPAGMGFIHYEDKEYSPNDLDHKINDDGSIHLDYFDGRMVKLSIRSLGDDAYSANEGRAYADYQSWSTKYPTYEDLISSVVEL